MLHEEIVINNKHLPGYSPVTFGQQQCPPLHTVGPHTRGYWLLHYVVSGTGIFRSGAKEYTLLPSQCFVIPPHRPIFYQSDKRNPWHYMWIGFTAEGGKIPDLLYNDIIPMLGFSSLFSSITEAKSLSSGREEYLSGKIWELMSMLIRLGEDGFEEANAYVIKAKKIIENQYMNGIGVAEIARELNLDRSYFSALFKRKTGQSPQEFLVGYKIEKAAEFIVKSGLSVTEAAFAAGYNDAVNFTRMFKRHFGVTPSKYKEEVYQSSKAGGN